jgi:hypothetical protein
MSQQTTAITRASLSNDIDILRSKGPSNLTSIAQNKLLSVPTPANAVEALESVSVNTSTPAETQPLTRAYIKAMRTEVLGLDGGANEDLGNKLDALRGRAEGISEALAEIKV